MTKPTALRLGITQAYKIRFPIIGRSFLSNDYNLALLRGLLLLQLPTNFFDKNLDWQSQNSYYSHSLVMWDRNRWLVQCFCFDKYDKRQLKVYKRIKKILKRMFRKYNKDQRYSFFRINKFSSKNKYKARLFRKRLPIYHMFFTASKIKRIHLNKYSKSKRVADSFSLKKLEIIRSSRFVPELLKKHDKLSKFTYNNHILRKKVSFFNSFSSYGRIRTGFIINHHKKFKFLKSFAKRLTFQFVNSQSLNYVTTRINSEYSKVLKCNVSFAWRIIQRIKHGNINIWMAYIRFRICDRAQYQYRKVFYDLLNFAKKNRMITRGWSIRFHGRFTRAQRSDRRTFKVGGALEVSNFSYLVDQSLFTFPLRYGSIGLTLTINYGSKFLTKIKKKR